MGCKKAFLFVYNKYEGKKIYKDKMESLWW